MTVATDEAAVRAYLRVLVGAPERASDSVDATESGFIKVGAKWAARAKVDRRTLSGLGVSKAVLDRAGIERSTVVDQIRPWYTSEPFDVSTIARRACVSEGAARVALAADERAGRVTRVHGDSRAARWRRSKP